MLKFKKLNYRYYIGIVLIAIAIVFGVIFIFRAPQTTEAAWWNITWSYRQSISITNSSGSELTDFQIQILDDEDLSSLVSAGKLESDLSDLRFTDNNHRVLDYWIEDSTNSSVNVWIKVSSIPTDGTTIYMYYGNSSASDESDISKMNQSGGVITLNNGYRIHTFTSSGTFRTADSINTETLVVAGGGGGGSSQYSSGGGGGGGAGGLIYNSSFAVPNGEYNVTVGTGGTAGTAGSSESGTNGTDSTFYTITTTGGGGGGKVGTDGSDGGSGGGAGYNGYSTVHYGGSGVVGQGNDGGDTSQLSWAGGAGGGGAGGVGGDNKINHGGGDAGVGLSYAISGSSVTYATGGTGGNNNPGASTPNTGDGGDGAYSTATAYDGADGIVIIRYASITDFSIGSLSGTEENAPGPIGYWNFDEGYGSTAYDSTGYGNDGTITGATWVKNGRKGGALSFDGNSYDSITNNDYISISNDSNLNFNEEITWSLWLKTEDMEGTESGDYGQGVLYKKSNPGYGSNTEGYNIWQKVSQGYFMLNLGDGTNAEYKIWGYSSNLDNYDNKWFNLTISLDNIGEVKFYFNGKLQSTQQFTEVNLSEGLSNSQDLIIGKGDHGTWDGLIDEVRIYDRALSEDEIKQLYNTNAGSFNVGQTRIPRSCADQLAMTPGSSSGTYIIDPGYGIDPLEVYCDMETEGGGWTRVMWNNATGSAVAPDDIMVNSYDESDHWSINPEEMSQMLDSQDVMLKQVSQVSAWPSSWSYLVAEDIGNWDYDQPLCTGSLLGHSGRSAGCANHGANDDYTSADGFNIAIYNDIFGGNSNDAFVPKYTYDYYSGSSNTGHIEFYLREDAVITTSGLVLDMSFESQSGSITYDESGNENNGTITGATWKTSANCKEGRCMDFDGDGDYIDAGNSSSLDITGDQFTFTAWIKHSFTPGSHTYANVFRKHWSSGNWLRFQQNQETLYFYLYGIGGVFSSTTLEPDVFYHVSAVYDGLEMKIYLNGVEDSSYNYSGNITSSLSDHLYIGAGGSSGEEPWEGIIDQVKIYNIALTQREIMEEMNNGKPGPVLDINFNEGGGDIAYDKSGQDNDGEIKANASWKNEKDCVSGSCVYIDGTNSTWNSVQVAEDDSLDGMSALSVGLWLKINEEKSHQVIYKRHTGTPSWSSYRINISNANVLSFNVTNESGSTGTAIASEVLSLNTWYHVVGVYDGAEVQIYVDGLAKDATPSALTGNVLDSPSYLQIGGLDGSWMMNGYIDELKIYPYALTTQEIKQEYIQSQGQFGQTNSIGTKTNPGSSCIDILERKTGAPSGAYWIDPTGDSISDAFEVFCDMETDGGGWTLISKIEGDSSNWLGKSSYWESDSELGDPTSLIPADAKSHAWYLLSSDELMFYDIENKNIIAQTDTSCLADKSVGYIFSNYKTMLGSNRGSYECTFTYRDESYYNPAGYTGCSYGSDNTLRWNVADNDGIFNNADDDDSARWSNTPQDDYPGGYGRWNGSGDGVATLDGEGDDCNFDYDGVQFDYTTAVFVRETTASSTSLGPILDMDFDQYSGGVYLDKSGNGYNGTPTGDPEWKKSVYCKEGRCLEFNGTSNYIYTSAIPKNSSYTISAWINGTRGQSVGGVVHSMGGSMYRWGISLESGNIVSRIGNDTATDVWSVHAYNETNYPTGWHLITLTDDGTTRTYYKDGIYIDEHTNTIVNSGLDQSIRVGRGGNSDASYFEGLIDEAKIYDRVLTQAEISNLYNGGAPVGWWRFDEGVDNLCSDGADVCNNSGEENNGIINGDPVWITNTSSCKQGGCLEFDGDDDYILLVDQPEFKGELTFSSWIKTLDTGMQTIYSEWQGGATIIILLEGDGEIRTYLSTNGTSPGWTSDRAYSINDGEWHNLVVLYNGFYYDIYIDGEPADVGNVVATGDVSRATVPPRIGVSETVAGNYAYHFDGLMDDVRFYNYALSPEQIKESYNGGLIKFK